MDIIELVRAMMEVIIDIEGFLMLHGHATYIMVYSVQSFNSFHINGWAIRDLFQKTLHIKLETPKWTIILEQVDTPLLLKQSRNSSVGRASGHMMIIIGQLQK